MHASIDFTYGTSGSGRSGSPLLTTFGSNITTARKTALLCVAFYRDSREFRRCKDCHDMTNEFGHPDATAKDVSRMVDIQSSSHASGRTCSTAYAARERGGKTRLSHTALTEPRLLTVMTDRPESSPSCRVRKNSCRHAAFLVQLFVRNTVEPDRQPQTLVHIIKCSPLEVAVAHIR